MKNFKFPISGYQFNDEIINNVIDSASYDLVHEKNSSTVISGKNCIIKSYFIEQKNFAQLEKQFFGQNLAFDENFLDQFVQQNAEFIQAHNGWVMGWDATKDFARTTNVIYENRRLVVWGDSVKLNYHTKYDECPVIYDYMAKYTSLMASIFDGLRIDNCHSTPIHVAKYLLSQARKTNPEILLMLELFTGNEDNDSKFVMDLGANMLVREVLHHKNLKSLGEFLWKFGGENIGSLKRLTHLEKTHLLPVVSGHQKSNLRVSPAIVYDMTHDNHSFYEIFGQNFENFDVAMTVLGGFCCAGFGSTKGHDEMVKHQISVVDYDQNYEISPKSCLMSQVKFQMNFIKQKFDLAKFSEQFVDVKSLETLILTRRNPETNDFMYVIASTGNHWLDLDFINQSQNHEFLENCEIFHLGNQNQLENQHLRIVPGSATIIFQKCKNLQFYHAPHLEALKNALKKFSISTLAQILFSCENEEKFRSGRGMYGLVNGEKLIFSGLYGFLGLAKHLIKNDDLGHPVFENIRQGNWLLNYLKDSCFFATGSGCFEKIFNEIENELNGNFTCLKPQIFTNQILKIFNLVSAELMSRLPASNSTLEDLLKFSSTALVGHVSNVDKYKKDQEDPRTQNMPTFAAGLPHFAEGIWRMWGRDVFISLDGCLIQQKRYEEALALILRESNKKDVKIFLK